MKIGLTFDDVLLIPRYSNVDPAKVDLTTFITKKIQLNIPLISAAMDSVTEAETAIAMARAGGIGIIHKNMSISEQTHQVEIVKRSESGMIIDPIFISPEQTIQQIIQIFKQHHISGLPVVDHEKCLLGLITNRDIRYIEDLKTTAKKAMTPFKKLITIKHSVSLAEAKAIMQKHKIEKLPIIDQKKHLIGLITSKDIDKSIAYPFASKDKYNRLLVGAAIGISDYLTRVPKLIAAGVDVFVLDSAHGHSASIINAIKDLKERFPEIEIIAGNIATAKAAEDLIAAGADAIKVGMGPGSICTTRIVAGIGMPQISAILEIAQISKTKGIPMIADGGIRYSGDITKALAAGANALMIGSLFAGCKETPGKEILYNGKKYKYYRGMGSLGAINQAAGKDRYSQGFQNFTKLVPEGIEAAVPYKGELSEIIFQLLGGVKSGFGYCGSKNIFELQTTADFVQISAAALKESHPHDVFLLREAPNYNNFDN